MIVSCRLAWSRGDVNRSFTGIPEADDWQSRACKTGLILQKFYQQCSLLPPGLGIAGRAATSRQYQWASGNELLQQINALSRYNYQLVPLALQDHAFQTIVCIPLLKNAVVLEIGNTELVLENDAVISHLLGFTNTIDGQVCRKEQASSSASYSGTRQCCDETELQQTTTAGYASTAMQIYRTSRHSSLPSSYRSSSSPISSSPSMEHMPTTMSLTSPSRPAHPSFNKSSEKMLMVPSSFLRAAPNSMVTSFGQPDPFELNQIRLLSDSPTSFSYFSTSKIVERPVMPFSTEHMPEYMPQQPMSNQYPEDDQYIYDSSVTLPFPSASQIVGTVGDQQGLTEGYRHASTIQTQEQDINSADATRLDSNVMLSQTVLGAGAETSSINLITQMQGSTSCIASRPSGDVIDPHQLSRHAFHIAGPEQTDSRLASRAFRSSDVKSMPRQLMRIDHIPRWLEQTDSRLASRAFRPWKLMALSRKKKLKLRAINTNRYNVKQIMRFHLPWLASMMNAERAARADNFVLMRRGVEAAQPSQCQLCQAAAEVDYRLGSEAAAGNVVKAVAYEQVNEAAAAKQHMFAERNRRRKQGDCLTLLRTLVPNITKSITHDLQQQNERLQKTIAARDQLENVQMGSCQYSITSQNSRKANTEKLASSAPPSPDTLLETKTASCELYPSSQNNVKHAHPRFELGFSMRDVAEANASIFALVSALKQKKLQCIDLKMEFDQSTKYMSGKIVAIKDEENYTPTLAEIQDIKQCYQLDKLSSTNYLTWATRVTLLLKRAALWDIVSGTTPKSAANDADWLAKDLQTQSELMLHLGDRQVQMVRRCQSSPEIWAFLRSTYHHEDLITRVTAFKKLLLAVLTEHQDISKFLDDWRTLLDNALLSGFLLDDSLQAMFLLAALPTSWRPFITTQASVVGLTVETLIDRILQEDAMRGNSTPTTIPSSQYVQRQSNFRRRPFCRFNNTRNPVNNPTPTKICIHCGRHGHLVHECRTKRREQQRTDRHPRSQLQHIEVLALNQYGMESLQLFTSMLNSTRDLATSTNTSAEWLLDTGATHHMTPTSSWLRDYKTLARHVQVYLGDNHCLHAIGLGNLNVTLPSGAAIIIRDIYHIPGLRRNILSITAATSSGSSIEFFHDLCVIHLKLPNGQFEIIKLPQQNRLYPIKLTQSENNTIISSTSIITLYLTKTVSTLMWHYRLGHVNGHTL
ncbi:hypothetical protein L7F22_016218 [Adiantum nelumboides]|nr:hypothetical protein [Adiantum nelumboides]